MCFLLAVNMLCTGQGWADTWQQSLTTRASTEFDSNPAMATSPQSGVWRGLFEPSYTLLGKVDANELNGGLSLRISRSSNKTLSPDQNGPTAFFNWLHPSEAGEFGISTRYVQMATRDAGGVDATGRVPAASTSTSRLVSGNWKKLLSERSSIAVDGAYQGVTYKGGTYTDFTTQSGGLKYSYISSENITEFARVSGNKYVPGNGGTSSTLTTATVGMDWKAEYWDWIMQIGKARVGSDSAGSQGSVEAHYTGLLTHLTLMAGRTVSPSGLGGFVKSDQLTGSWGYTLSEYSNAGIDLSRQKILATTTTPSSTSSTSRVWIDHTLTAFWSLRTYYQHRTAQGGAGLGASSNMVGLSLAYINSDF
jgi:hypothetical protein